MPSLIKSSKLHLWLASGFLVGAIISALGPNGGSPVGIVVMLIMAALQAGYVIYLTMQHVERLERQLEERVSGIFHKSEE